LANEKVFECEICESVYGTSEEADNCCVKEKIAMQCKACGKSNSSKKHAINCCTSAKKKFSKKVG
jgi:hypothetical protein